MKLIFKEFSVIDYNRYYFPYCVYCIKEQEDTYNDIYSKGFLPYTNDFNIEDEIYYLARSVKVDLTGKIWNYKQYNVFNKMSKIFSDADLKIQLLDKQLVIADADFKKWCLQNAKNHFLTEERLNYILSRPYLKNILVLKNTDQVLAYQFVVEENNRFFHTWFSFYDLNININDFGKWIILKVIEWCKSNNYVDYYIGTCYSKHAFYKLTLSPATSYFDGSTWNTDISTLKQKLLME